MCQRSVVQEALANSPQEAGMTIVVSTLLDSFGIYVIPADVGQGFSSRIWHMACAAA
jgi:hypothetical protein